MRLISMTFAASVLALVASCAPNDAAPVAPPTEQDAPETVAVPALEQVWVASGFSAPEGVAVYADTLIISNVAGEGADKDGEGWLSRVSMTGETLEQKWVTGLNAPKGMAVRDNILFVADIDAYHTIDANTGRILNTFDIEGANFLNDVTVWGGGVYASDSANARIYQLDENGYKQWLEDPELAGINGLLGRGDEMLVSTMDEGLLVTTRGDRSLTEIARGMVNADGIAALPGGDFLVSSWRGQIWHVSVDGEKTELLNTEGDGIFQNDLTGVGDLIIVPNWQPGTVTAWRLVN